MSLSDEDRAVLRLADERWLRAGGKVQAMYDRFGLSEVAFYARVNALLDDPAAEVAEPAIVRRLARLRDARRRQRAPRRRAG